MLGKLGRERRANWGHKWVQSESKESDRRQSWIIMIPEIVFSYKQYHASQIWEKRNQQIYQMGIHSLTPKCPNTSSLNIVHTSLPHLHLTNFSLFPPPWTKHLQIAVKPKLRAKKKKSARPGAISIIIALMVLYDTSPSVLSCFLRLNLDSANPHVISWEREQPHCGAWWCGLFHGGWMLLRYASTWLAHPQIASLFLRHFRRNPLNPFLRPLSLILGMVDDKSFCPASHGTAPLGFHNKRETKLFRKK